MKDYPGENDFPEPIQTALELLKQNNREYVIIANDESQTYFAQSNLAYAYAQACRMIQEIERKWERESEGNED